ncbi:MAG: FAD-dependent oxidoreductase, partial [Muribaculaceae bacterium]|nr:FAD-dependent oxidoreductase [Muribaculaceae bacterium]
MKFSIKFVALMCSAMIVTSCGHKELNTDLLIIGGGASGTAAGIQAARMDVNAIIVEESPWLGGMLTSAGVSCIDGNSRMPSGFFGEFRDSIAALYGGYDNLRTNWVADYSFEPSVGNALFHRMVEREKDHLKVINGARLVELTKKTDGWVAVIENENGEKQTIKAKIVIDGTEFGDVARMTGVGYDLGMENGRMTGEDIAPDSAYNIVQDMTFVAVLKDYGKDADMTIDEPEGYDPMLFANTCQNPLATPREDTLKFHTPDYMMGYGKLQNGKYMINWPFAANDYYANIVDMTREERDSVLALAKQHTMKYLYFLQTQLGYKNLALADDEYPTEDHLPFIPYVRESRRIHGKVRVNVNHV